MNFAILENFAINMILFKYKVRRNEILGNCETSSQS